MREGVSFRLVFIEATPVRLTAWLTKHRRLMPFPHVAALARQVTTGTRRKNQFSKEREFGLLAICAKNNEADYNLLQQMILLSGFIVGFAAG